ncbi:MAG: TerC family protein [Terrimicrobiaceae bacterium]|nr:TerC family protein [Terrimicrobiaceae bacterium]
MAAVSRAMNQLADLMNAGSLVTLALLVGLELVLGIDNILVISLVVSRLPPAARKRARLTGLAIALLMRLVFVAFAFRLVHLTDPIFYAFSIKDLVLFTGGLFLIYKAVVEIHHVIELKEEEGSGFAVKNAVPAAIAQIVLLDIVFSVDSVITAVGLTQNLLIIALAVIVSFVGLLFYAGPIGEFILRHPTLKILALAFLVTIGVTLCLEGMHKHVERGYIYLPMGFALLVELLQMRYFRNAERSRKEK